jgi:hemolysin III
MTLLFFSSAIYHLPDVNENKKKLLKRIDHIMIYFLIAGSYTPFCLIPLKGAWGWSILAIIWLIAFLGVIFKIFFINAPRKISTLIYLVMGWICIVAIYPLIKTMPTCGIFWLATGGLFYSIGAIIYAIKKPNPYPGKFGFHEIWHLFVIAGSACHYIVMYSCIMQIK